MKVIKQRKANNPKGCPNMNIGKARKTGPITKEGKLRSLVSTGNVKDKTKSKILNYYRHCSKCPLRPRTEVRLINNKEQMFTIASKCPSYKEGHKCVIPKSQFANSLNFYYKQGGEKMDALSLQEAIAYKSLENAEIAKQAEMVRNATPGFYTEKFMRLASDSNSVIVKSQTTQKIQTENKNLNVNVDWTEAIIAAYEKDKKEDEND